MKCVPQIALDKLYDRTHSTEGTRESTLKPIDRDNKRMEVQLFLEGVPGNGKTMTKPKTVALPLLLLPLKLHPQVEHKTMRYRLTEDNSQQKCY